MFRLWLQIRLGKWYFERLVYKEGLGNYSIYHLFFMFDERFFYFKIKNSSNKNNYNSLNSFKSLSIRKLTNYILLFSYNHKSLSKPKKKIYYKILINRALLVNIISWIYFINILE